ncbi:MAG: hypothetical protein WDO14_13635 [Bacteroidota bacterium]
MLTGLMYTGGFFVAAAGISFIIAFVSMSVQVVKAAVANPVSSLKD